MKTTIDIPDDILEQSMKFTGAKTKRDAVVAAMGNFNRRSRAEAFLKRIENSPPHGSTSDEKNQAAAGNRSFDYHHEPSGAHQQ